MIIDQHQPVVEKYYGNGKMANVIVRLLQECDRVAKSLTESWEEERSMKRKVIHKTAPTIAHPDRLQLSEITNVVPSPILTSPANRRQPTQGSTVEDEVDAREIDKVISEAAGMASRWNLFRRFLYDRLRVCTPLYEFLCGD